MANLDLVNADALDIDLAADFPLGRPDIVAGNLPYYVATPLIERTVRLGLPGVFLIQKEVAQRLAAQPGGRDYGFLTVADATVRRSRTRRLLFRRELSSLRLRSIRRWWC